MAMQPGMVTSIEPGLYRAGQWGVRIENLVLNVAAKTTELAVAYAGFFLNLFNLLPIPPLDGGRIVGSIRRH